MPFNVNTTATRKTLPKPEILSHPLDTPVIESVVVRAAGVTADVSGPYTGRRYLVAGTILSNRGDGTYEKYLGTGHTDPKNEVQKITVKATAGNWKATIEGTATANILFSATAAEVEAALKALPAVGQNDLNVTGGPGDATGTKPYIVTFTDPGNVAPITVADVDLTGGEDAVADVTVTGGVTEVEGSQNIAGIMFDTVEFADATAGSNEPTAMVCQDLKLDKNKIIGFAEFESELLEWAKENNNKFFNVKNAQEA
jgi:hypothetical protein